VQGNGRAATWFEKLTFGQLVDRAAERWGDREALCFEGRRWTFAGVEPGEHVCLWLNNCPEYLFTLFAVAKIGASWCRSTPASAPTIWATS
jgi:fatty-acyl-CoA synthase